MKVKSNKKLPKLIFFPMIFACAIFLSCQVKSKNKIVRNPTEFNNTVHVKALADTSQSYEVYVPKSKGGGGKLPLVILFDPHGSGLLAIEKAKVAAEQLGFILAASNNSKNGLTNTREISETLLADVLKRYPVEESRIYAAGFSGGGRVAYNLALSNKKIRGIITCSAGLSNFNPFQVPNKFEIYGTAGKHDFNYDEVMEIANVLDKTDWRHLVTAFDGGHNWPPASYFMEALEWFDLNAMKDGLIPKDKDRLESIQDNILTTAEGYTKLNQFIAAATICRNGIGKLDGLQSIKSIQKKLDEILKTEGYKTENEKAGHVRFIELKLRDGYMQNFNERDTTWWAREINELKDRILNERDSLNRQMYSRVKGFLGIICYSYTGRAMASGDVKTAARCLAIYQLAEPQNPDCFYFKALLSDRLNRKKEAVGFLKKAFDYGFTDQSKLSSLSAEVIKQAEVVK